MKKKHGFSDYLAIYGCWVGCIGIAYCCMFGWEVLTRGSAFAYDRDNLLFWGKQAFFGLGVSALFTAASWFADWLDRRPKKLRAKSRDDPH